MGREHALYRFTKRTKYLCKMLVARRICGVREGPQPSVRERLLSNPLDTVSLLEIGLHSYVSEFYQRLSLAQKRSISSLTTIQFVGFFARKLSHSVSGASA